MTSINVMVAAEHVQDLHGAAAKRRPRRVSDSSAGETAQASAVALRMARDEEGHIVRLLAALDDAPGLKGPVLLALVNGEPVAALSLLDRRVVANPFVLTQEPVALLRVRANHLLGEGRRRGLRAFLRPRLA